MRVRALVLALVLAACAAPTLPLPPPVAPSVSNVDAAHYRLRGDHSVSPHAIVVTYNQYAATENRAFATEADDNGSWELIVVAAPGDLIDVWQETGTTRGPPVSVAVPR